ncbi:MAG TPA: nuclease-related domain-containing protein [Candidatus Saccharimonadales bacterium]|nr:nuclease-related domain-containing protein [Candidatus Saccharimonadales bacterium]
MSALASKRWLRLRRSDRCALCDHELAAGDEAIWDPVSRTVTCLGCDLGEAPVVEGQAGASAFREYERRRQRREQHARDKLGGLGVLLARVIDEPETTKAWQQGGAGEVRAGARLAKHLEGYAVNLLHDRRIPGHGNANIDHLAIGPGGVTVIDTKTHRGKIRVDRMGGLFCARRSVLTIGGRDQTRLIDRVECQVDLVRTALSRVGEDQIDVRGAFCFPHVDGLPILARLSVRGIIIDGPKRVAKLARRPGPLHPETIDRIWSNLGHSFSEA